ncbi:hypothetical protein V8J88_05520 [Massilia sp. W12]|uniref:hypothetical protein n=1 Tax=Massilia sp. W12 TaxID=3126507 RepID=UPI0030D178B1
MVFDVRRFDSYWDMRKEYDGRDILEVINGELDVVNGEDGIFLKNIIEKGYDNFLIDCGKKAKIENYTVMIWKYPIDFFCEIAFVPKTEWLDGYGFEVPKQGVWRNGPGISYYYDWMTWELQRKVWMK